MEDLNKTQIVLLCLLVSFVTSIGTGIITASLLEEAPQSITQTINRVVERTVEKVVPQTSSNVVTKEVTVVVKEEDLVIDAIKRNSRSLVRIYGQPIQDVPQFLGIALVIGQNGTLIADKRIITPTETHTAKFHDGKSFPIKVIEASEKGNAVYLSIVKDSAPYTFHPVVTSNSDKVQLGQTVIALGGMESNQVSIGRVSFLTTKDGETSTSTKVVTLIETDTVSKENIAGTLLLNLSGEMIGMQPWTLEAANADRFIPINILRTDGEKYFDTPKNNNP